MVQAQSDFDRKQHEAVDFRGVLGGNPNPFRSLGSGNGGIAQASTVT
jgi:hypothetical protein